VVVDDVNVLIEKMKVIKCMDVEEKSLKEIEMMYSRNRKYIIKESGVNE
jgi:hypothetical protein